MSSEIDGLQQEKLELQMAVNQRDRHIARMQQQMLLMEQQHLEQVQQGSSRQDVEGLQAQVGLEAPQSCCLICWSYSAWFPLYMNLLASGDLEQVAGR